MQLTLELPIPDPSDLPDIHAPGQIIEPHQNEKILSLRDRLLFGPPTQREFEWIVAEAATIRMRKVLSYGEDGYKEPDIAHAMMINYSDIHRKHIRVKAMVLNELQQPDPFNAEQMPDGEAFRDALLDLANYALMGVQLLEAHRQRQLKQSV